MTTERHPCPCCGYRTYSVPAGGTMLLCPVCGWEDAPGETPYNLSNDVSLVQGQRHYQMFGACERHLEGVVRPPLAEETRSLDWLSFDSLREKITASIEKAFHDVTRDGGTTLHQMALVDGGWPMTAKAMKDAERQDPETRWQDIPTEKLAHFSQSLVFLNHLGFRFYLPAFMRHALASAWPDIDHADLDGVMWSLDEGPKGDFRGEAFSLLTSDQMRSTAAFVYLFATLGNDYDASYARKGIERGWRDFVPDYLHLCFQ